MLGECCFALTDGTVEGRVLEAQRMKRVETGFLFSDDRMLWTYMFFNV